MVEDSLAKVDYLVQVDNIPRVLIEVKSPSVMQTFGKKLPLQGIELSWLTGAPLQVRILTKVSTLFNSLFVIIFIGVCGGRTISWPIRKLKWLFITSHNEWIACRLVRRDGHHPFLVYSNMVTMQDSSIPFRAFLAAILSVMHHIDVEPSVFDPTIALDIVENRKNGSKPEILLVAARTPSPTRT